MKGLVHSYTCYTRVGKTALSAGADRVWQAQWMGVVRLTQCQPHSAPGTVGQCSHGKKRHFFYKPHLFYILRHSQQPQKGQFLASRKPALTRNRMCLTCGPMFFSGMYSFPLWIFNTTFVGSLQKYLTGLKQVFNVLGLWFLLPEEEEGYRMAYHAPPWPDLRHLYSIL